MASTGRVRLAVYGGDQKLYNGKSARVVLRVLESTGVRQLFEVSTKPGEEPVFTRDLDTEANLSYILNVNASNHISTGNIFKAKSGRNIEIRAMLIPKDPEPDFSGFSYKRLKDESPSFHDALVAGNITEDAFRNMHPTAKAGALNIESKLRNTTLLDAKAVEFIKRINDIGQMHQDRIYAWFDPTLHELLRSSSAFKKFSANEGEHPGFPISYRQRTDYATMQFSLSEKEVGGLIEADVDIDLYPVGIGHLLEVTHNKIKGLTNPYTVYTLLFNQGISPMYTIKTRQS